MRKMLLVFCGLAVCSMILVAPALATEQESADTGDAIVVSTADELISVMETIEDGGIILISQQINLPEGCTIGDDAKTVTLMRSSEYLGCLINMPFPGTLKNLVFEGENRAGGSAIYAGGTNTSIVDCTFQNFTGDNSILSVSNGADLTIERCNFKNNFSSGTAPVMFTYSGAQISIYDSVFEDNTASSNAGAIKNSGDLLLSGCVFTGGCASSGGGGAIYNGSSGTLAIEICTLTGNNALRGGAIENYGTLTITDSLIYGNTADAGANDVVNLGGKLSIRNTVEEYTEIFGETVIIPLGWYSDHFDSRYGKDNAVPFSFPVEDYEAFAWLIFAYRNPTDTDEDDSPSSGEELGEIDDTTVPPTEPENDNELEAPAPTPENGSENGNSGYTPPYIPPWPGNSSPQTPTAETEREDATKGANEPTDADQETYRPFVCGSATLDTSSEAYLLGYGDGLTHDDDFLTRAQMATIICRLLTEESLQAVQSTTNDFTDVSADAWYNEAVSTIANAGIVVGVGNGKFDPDGTLTWSQIITIFARFVELQTDTTLEYIDIDTHWSADYVKTAVALGWIADSDDFSPDEPITRGEMVNFVNHLFGMWNDSDG